MGYLPDQSGTWDGCRWSNYLEKILKSKYMEVFIDHSYSDYQGNVRVFAKDINSSKFLLCEYSYGSCSRCDSWEDQPEDVVAREMEGSCSEFSSRAHLLEYLMMLEAQNPDGVHWAIPGLRKELGVD